MSSLPQVVWWYLACAMLRQVREQNTAASVQEGHRVGSSSREWAEEEEEEEEEDGVDRGSGMLTPQL